MPGQQSICAIQTSPIQIQIEFGILTLQLVQAILKPKYLPWYIIFLQNIVFNYGTQEEDIKVYPEVDGWMDG